MKVPNFSPPSCVQDVAARLAQLGGDPHYVGGAVRDTLIGRKPHDYDIASSLSPDEVQRAFDNVIPTGAKHGTVTVVVAGENVEVTTFRSDGDYADGRHPTSVTFVPSILLDLGRRDFTMNAVAISAVTGDAVDPHGGISDAQFGIIRTVGDPHARFAEDGLRMMRAARFASQLGFEIDERTLAAIDPKRLDGVSSERIRDELLKILASDKPAIGLGVLGRTGILQHVLGTQLTHAVLSVAHMLSTIDRGLRLAVVVCNVDDHVGVALTLKKQIKLDSTLAQLCAGAARAASMLKLDTSAVNIRTALSALGRDAVVAAALSTGDATTVALAKDEPIINAKSLPFNGDDIMRKLGISGASIGALIRTAVQIAIKDPSLLTDSDSLLALAQL